MSPPINAPPSLRALTVCAPFAHLIAAGAKTIENRTRPTLYRGQVLIHAGLRRTYDGQSVAAWCTRFDVDPAALIFGAVIGVADLADCIPLARAARDAHAVGPWCWLLNNARRLAAPIPCRGQLGLWTPDASTRVALAHARPTLDQTTLPLYATEVRRCG